MVFVDKDVYKGIGRREKGKTWSRSSELISFWILKFKKVPKDGAIVLFLDSAILQHIGQLISEGFHQFSTQLVNKVNHLEWNP